MWQKTRMGFIFGTPVHFAAASGFIVSFMDRLFYADLQSNKQSFYLKPAAAVISARRAGTTNAFDQINKYFYHIGNARYLVTLLEHGLWSHVEDVAKDLEGLQTMRVLAKNMAWFLKCKDAGKKAGVKFPEKEKSVYVNFIRE